MSRRRGVVQWALWALVTALGWTPAAWAGSLWDPAGSLFADLKARAVGDLVTLIILERAEASHRATTSTSQEAEVRLRASSGPLAGGFPLLGAGGGDETSAAGTTSRRGLVEAKMTARVTEVLPGGNLRIEGRQSIVINGEEQAIVVTGIVRPQDISRDNTVLSTYLADAQIVIEGDGPLGERQSPGLLTRIFQWLF